GDRTDIHPTNKVELGKRLAFEALGKGLPRPVSARRATDGVRVAFANVEGALESWSGPPLAFELCGETQESCRFASVTLADAEALLHGDGQRATRVRYAWADSPVVNTYDGRAMPLPGFEIAVEQ